MQIAWNNVGDNKLIINGFKMGLELFRSSRFSHYDNQPCLAQYLPSHTPPMPELYSPPQFCRTISQQGPTAARIFSQATPPMYHRPGNISNLDQKKKTTNTTNSYLFSPYLFPADNKTEKQ
jgi:hypothetical protein